MQKKDIQVGTVYAVADSKYSTPVPVRITDKEHNFPRYATYSRSRTPVGTEKGIRGVTLDPKDPTGFPPEVEGFETWYSGKPGAVVKVQPRHVLRTWDEHVEMLAREKAAKEERNRKAHEDIARLTGVRDRIIDLLDPADVERFHFLRDEPYVRYGESTASLRWKIGADTLLAVLESARTAGHNAGYEEAVQDA